MSEPYKEGYLLCLEQLHETQAALAAERARADAAVAALRSTQRSVGKDGLPCWCHPIFPADWHMAECRQARAVLAAEGREASAGEPADAS